MASQRIVWIALPAGSIERDGQQFLRLSIFVAPRLTPDEGRERLEHFPDWLAWGATAAAMREFEVEIEGGSVLAGRRASSRQDPALWPRLFAPELPVRPFEFDDYADRTIVSFPAADTAAAVKRAVQSLVFASPNALPSVTEFIESFGPFAVDLKPDLARRIRDEIRREQAQNPLDLPDVRRSRAPLSTEQIVARALLFHSSEAVEPVELPRPGPQLRELFDFHQALAQLGDYPEPLRRLGIVLDIEILAEELAFSGAAAPLRIRARPRWESEGSVELQEMPSWTAFVWDGKAFRAAPRPAPVPELVDGLLNLANPDYTLEELDVDGAVLKQSGAVLSVLRGLARRAPDAPTGEAPAALRSGGLALLRRDRALRLHGVFGRAAERNAELESGGAVAPLYAEDLVRGFTVDVCSSLTGAWHSLFRRVGDYHFLSTGTRITIEDEGFSQTAVTHSAVPPGTAQAGDLRLHEALWAWNGWSLAAPRPGKAILSGAGSEAEPQRVANDAQTSVPLEVTFRAAPRSLPRLRYGARYRMRARAVDLAGNAVPLATAGEAAVVPSAGERPYRRVDPVPPPTVVLRERLARDERPGESLETLVIRSRNASPELDAAATTERAERHLAPPRTSIQESELHGMLDAPTGGLLADTETYEMLRARDTAELPADPATRVPVEPAAVLSVPYLPDPLARGAALRNLPGVAEGAIARSDSGGLVQERLPGVLVRPGSATVIDFELDPAWPRARGFRLVLLEGDDPPRWDAERRELTVFLPKAHAATVPVSSFVEKADLGLLAVWSWLREVIDGRTALEGRNPSAMLDLGVKTAHVAQLALEGGLWAITPARILRLVHAVQQPLRAPILALTAVREPASTAARLVGEIAVHGRSTGSVELQATWVERVDDDEAGPGERAARDQPDFVPIRELAGGILRNGDRAVGTYLPDRDIVLCTADAHPRHELGDTKHRVITYCASAVSRFTNCFDPGEPGGFARRGPEVAVAIPASARPAPPALEYVVPTFGWQRHTDTNVQASVRTGRSLRVYLRRPWYSSGDGELLGVVLRPAGLPAPTDDEREAMKPFITQWGTDPLWGGAPLPPLPTRNAFPLAVGGADAVALPERRGEAVAVAAHKVVFDAERKLWFCDIELDVGHAYFPFVRLALARYQPTALADCHLSTVVLAAFAQVAPDRTLIVTRDPEDGDLLHVTVSGATYGWARDTSMIGAPVVRTGSEVTIEVQKRVPGLEEELAWRAFGEAVITPLDTQRPDAVLWRGTVHLPSPRLPGQFRILAREHEAHDADPEPGVFPLPAWRRTAYRLVYADGIVI